jgi:hypothetical protein
MQSQDPVVTIAQLAAVSDLIVLAKVLETKSLLIDNESLVATDYTIQPIRVLKQNPALIISRTPGSVPSTNIVRRVGGTLVEGKYRYFTQNKSFPEEKAPHAGDEVVWFLTYEPTERVYIFSGGPFAAFRLVQGRVVPLTEEVAIQRGDEPVDLAKFLRDVQGLITGRQ